MRANPAGLLAGLLAERRLQFRQQGEQVPDEADVGEVKEGQQASFTLTIPPGYTAQASGCGGALSGSTYTTAAITGPCTVSASFTPPPANGACGDTAPSLHWPTSLCSAGSPTNPFATSDAFRWNCAGTHGGRTP